MVFWPRSSKLIPANPRRDNIPYGVATREHSRVSMHNLPPEWRHDALQFARALADRGGPFSRRHSIEDRLAKYINKPSRCGRYIEVLPHEVDEIKKASLLLRSPHLLPVEFGFNAQKQVCKVAFTVPLRSSNRILFMCIGVADGG